MAAEGYLALAPDLYARGKGLRCVMATVRASRSGEGPAYADIDAARVHLASREDCTGKVGVIGFCMGGGFALVTALRSEFAASSVNYGYVPKDIAARATGGCAPVVASFGSKDFTLRGAARRLESALDAARVPNDVKEYPGVGHSFMNQVEGKVSGPLLRVTGFRYDAAATADAWARILAFFSEHLRGEKAAT